MSYKRIPEKYMDAVISISRESTTKDDVGGMTVSESVIYSEINGSIQGKSSNVTYELQGRQHLQSHIGIINKNFPSEREIEPGDYLTNYTTGRKYLILGIDETETFRHGIDTSGYIRLSLEHIGDARYEYMKDQEMTVKAYIS